MEGECLPTLALGRAGLFCCLHPGTSCYIIIIIIDPLRHAPDSQLQTPRGGPQEERNTHAHTCAWARSPSLAREHSAFPIHLRESSQYWATNVSSTKLRDTTPRRDQSRRRTPAPTAPALPSHKPPWRGPLGTKGEILQKHTSWLALGTREEHAVSTAPPAACLPRPSQANHDPSRCLQRAAGQPGNTGTIQPLHTGTVMRHDSCLTLCSPRCPPPFYMDGFRQPFWMCK